MRPSSFAPCARYRGAISNEGRSQDGAVTGLDTAHSEMLVEIEVHRAETGLGGGELLSALCGSLEGLLNGSMQPPAVALANQLWAPYRVPLGNIARKHTNFEPGPARAGPHSEHDGVRRAFFPQARVEGGRRVPGARRDRWPLPERPLLLALLAWFSLVLLFACSPRFERGEKCASRAKGRIDGGAPEHRGDIRGDVGEWQNGMGALLRRMGEFLQGGEGLLVLEREDALMGLDDLKGEGHDPIVERLMLREGVG